MQVSIIRYSRNDANTVAKLANRSFFYSPAVQTSGYLCNVTSVGVK